ncbi:GIY-YIG nuclease family protein [Candidatus Gottesmanbacteria bacterium]|nr:GIY-YIG nuclease family protein [Candidatus Gottesmanbacteria bacterium]
MTIRQYFVYIATNPTNTVLYTGVTNHLGRRIFEHKFHFGSSFTTKYNITKLVYYEIFTDIREAILREKQIKAGSRKKKIDLINSTNPLREDLFTKIF